MQDVSRSQSSTAAALEMISIPLLAKRVQHNLQAWSRGYCSQQGSHLFICYTIHADVCWKHVNTETKNSAHVVERRRSTVVLWWIQAHKAIWICVEIYFSQTNATQVSTVTPVLNFNTVAVLNNSPYPWCNSKQKQIMCKTSVGKL